jgi:hypothetical protein
MEHPKAKGDRSTLAIMLALIEAEYAVYEPFGENTRCDLIIERDEVLSRVQCKTGRLRRGAVHFAVCSCYGHHRRPREARRDYHGQIDYFGVFCREIGTTYLVPIADLAVRNTAALRIDAPRNGQRHRVRFAADYELARVSVVATKEPGASAGGSGSSA